MSFELEPNLSQNGLSQKWPSVDAHVFEKPGSVYAICRHGPNALQP